MSSTHLSLQYHLVFSTKNRQPFIQDAWRDHLHRFLGGCLKQVDATPLEINGVADHVHLLAGLKSTHRLADVLKDIKTASSRWVHEHQELPRFAWQEGYGAFTVSESDVPNVRRYIAAQREHHRTRRFEDEYRLLLHEHNVTFDEHYLW
jgi:putative transposase